MYNINSAGLSSIEMLTLFRKSNNCRSCMILGISSKCPLQVDILCCVIILIGGSTIEVQLYCYANSV